MKQTKEEKFIQIGIKKDGKVIKSEEYSIGDFFGNVYTIPDITVPDVKINLFNIIFKTKAINNYLMNLREELIKMNRATQESMMEKAIRITNMKEFGKKTKYPLKNRFEQLDKK